MLYEVWSIALDADAPVSVGLYHSEAQALDHAVAINADETDRLAFVQALS